MKIKLIKSLLLIIVIMLMLSTSSFGRTQPYLEDLEDYNPQVETNSGSTYIKETTGKILGVINVVGVVCSVAVLGIMGINYMAGSVEEKAEYKKTMSGYIIGAVILFSASTIPNLLYNMSMSITTESDESPVERHDPPSPKPGLPDLPIFDLY